MKTQTELNLKLHEMLDQLTTEDLRSPRHQSWLFAFFLLSEWLESPDPKNIPDHVIKEINAMMRFEEPNIKKLRARMGALPDSVQYYGGKNVGDHDGSAYKRFIELRKKLDARLDEPEVEHWVEC